MSKTYKAKCTLYTDDADFDTYKEMYINCNDIECLMNEITADTIFEYIDDCKQAEFEDFIYGIKNKDRLVLLTGIFSTWNGSSKTAAIETLDDVLHNILEDYNTVKFDDGILKVEAAHHDGTNIFEIRPLTKKGIKYYKRNEFNYDLKEPVSYMIANRPYCIGKFTLEEVTL